MKWIVVCLPLVVACGDDTNPGTHDADVAVPDGMDAYVDPYPCWPDGVAEVPHGTLELGGGRGGFHELTDPYPIEWGPQDGFMFVVQLRMTGFAPGDSSKTTDPSAPRTRIRAYFDETNIPLNRHARCDVRTPYVDNGNGAYELVQEHNIIFETCWRSDRLIGERIRIQGEIKEPDGRYVSVTRVVTAAPPQGDAVLDQDSEPCPP